MRLNKWVVFMSVITLALLAVLCLQVIWVLHTARMKEDIFKEKAQMVLAKTTAELARDSGFIQTGALFATEAEKKQTDSLLQFYMQLYHIDLQYDFELVAGTANQSEMLTPYTDNQGNYNMCIQDKPMGKQAYELVLTFPQRRQYIWAQMGVPFFATVGLVILVMILTGRAMSALQKEKKIVEAGTHFFNNMTHELKTPLTNMALAGNMLKRELQAGHTQKALDYWQMVMAENEKLKQQVELVLGMWAIERGEAALQLKPVDVHELLQEVKQRMQLQLDAAGGELVMQLDAAPAIIQADTLHLLFALCNVVDNAIKYTQQKPYIHITTANEQNGVTIKIEDNGTGIPIQYHNRVFDMYYRVPQGNVHTVKGFGIGLAYVKNMVNRHGGKVYLQSEPGKGSVFTLYLPYGNP